MSELDEWLAKKRGAKVEAPQPATSGASELDQWLAKRRGAKPAPQIVLPSERQEFGRRPQTFDQTLRLQQQERLRSKPSGVDWGRGELDPAYSAERRREEFAKKPLLTQLGERGYDAFARSGGYLSKAARQATGAQLGLARGLATGNYKPVDIAPWRRYEEERDAELEAQRQARPSSFVTDVGEGIIEAAPIAAAGGLLGAAGGGGALASSLAGGGLTAAGADWRDPKRAAVQTALGAAAPVIGGKVGGAVASRLVRPTSRVAGELIGGGSGNVLGSAIEQAAFEGRISPRELARQAVIGTALAAPGALAAGRRPPTRPTGPTQVRPTQPLPQIAEAFPDAPATQRMPAISAQLRAENAPTSALQQSARLPVREFADELPGIYGYMDPDPFKIRADLSEPKSYAEAKGPSLHEALALSASPTRRPSSQPPVTPPPIDSELGKLWKRSPEQASLFKGAPSEKASWLEKLTALRRAGLLTSPATHARNVAGTWTNIAAQEVARIPAAITDLAVSAFTGRRTVAGPSPRGLAQSFREAATKGRREAIEILRKGAAPEDLERLQLSDPTFTNPIAKAYTQTVFRSLSAADRVANVFAYKRSLLERARAQALTEARKNRNINVNKRAQELAASPDASMALGAVEDALNLTLNNENLVNVGLGALKQKIATRRGGKAAGFVVDLVAPFVKTPTNAVARVLEYSGGGFLKGGPQIARAIIQRSMTPAQQRAISQSLGRAATGTAGLILTGYILAEKGMLTGFSEEDEGRRNRDQASGRQPGSIYDPVSGEWRKISGLAPVSTLLLIGATIQRERARSGEDRDASAFERYGKIGAQVVGESPLAIGSRDVATALTRPGTLSEKAGSFAGSFVPSIVSGAGAAMDEKEREGRGFTGRIQSRVPYLRESLPEQTDVLGRELPHRRFDFLNPAPGSTAKDKAQAFERELMRLDVGLSAPKKADGETESQYRERKRLAGSWVESYGKALIQSDRYKSASRELQRAAWRKLVEESHRQSDEGYPDLERMRPATLMESVTAAAYQKQEREREKARQRR